MYVVRRGPVNITVESYVSLSFFLSLSLFSFCLPVSFAQNIPFRFVTLKSGSERRTVHGGTNLILYFILRASERAGVEPVVLSLEAASATGNDFRGRARTSRVLSTVYLR